MIEMNGLKFRRGAARRWPSIAAAAMFAASAACGAPPSPTVTIKFRKLQPGDLHGRGGQREQNGSPADDFDVVTGECGKPPARPGSTFPCFATDTRETCWPISRTDRRPTRTAISTSRTRATDRAPPACRSAPERRRLAYQGRRHIDDEDGVRRSVDAYADSLLRATTPPGSPVRARCEPM